MNQYVTGAMIRELREKKGLTQAELAEKLFVSDKTVSKWENGKGYPDISLLESLAQTLDVSVSELLSGRAVSNVNISANMLRSKFYVCPVCGNAIHSMGEAAISCHGVLLAPAQAEYTDEEHKIFIEAVEDEYYVRIEHDMTKQHYISFIAALSPDRIQMVRLYPEGPAETRFPLRAVRRIYFYCNRDGLFFIDVHKAIDAKQSALDNSAERRALEETAKKLFG
ncbi:MAG: helix-turn-helix domain-containing protein [Clostridia bacterium]|nr:helix-turn-helix domain-containing protein [Clostridia bacterium]